MSKNNMELWISNMDKEIHLTFWDYMHGMDVDIILTADGDIWWSDADGIVQITDNMFNSITRLATLMKKGQKLDEQLGI